MRCSFQRPHRGSSTGRPVVKHQRKPVGGPTDPHIETPAIRQPNMIKSFHAPILHPRVITAHGALALLADRDRCAVAARCEGTVGGFGLANPKLAGERDQARQMLKDQAANRPPPGTAIVTDKGLVGQDTAQFCATLQLNLTLIRPARKDERPPRSFPNWLRQRIEAINRGHHLDPEEPARPRTPRPPRPRRAVGPRRPVPARSQRRHLVQLADRRPGQALPHRL